ncbi:nucleotidyltransferase domain-containing protein [Desulfosarcina ovata]|nr:nucleotidyltransferase domain-containing protein [Desulfosarcina ovata]
MANSMDRLQSMLTAISRIKIDMQAYYPRALLLFGSLARYLAGDPGDRPPNDIDLLVVTGNPPLTLMKRDFGCPVELHRFTVDRMVGIARALRYDSRPMALAKLYGSVLTRKHAIDVIAAAMLLGPAYGDFGIEQIERDGITDTRDYSIHQVLIGDAWWARLRCYAQQRRGPLLRFSDKLAGVDGFDG